jgi:LuxR family maltose regulon positive regulatory protein
MVEARLPNGEEESEPAGSSEVLRSFIALSQGKLGPGLELAEQALEVLPPEEIFLRDFAVFCAAGGRIASGDEEGGQRLLEQSTKANTGSRNPSATVIFLTELAEMRLKQMQLDKSEDLYQRALIAARISDGEYLPIGGRALIGLGNIALERFELDLAKDQLIVGAELAGRWNLLSRIEGYISLAVLYHARGEWKELEATVEKLHELTRRFDTTDADDWIVDLVESRLNVLRGDLNAVRSWVTQRGLDKAPYQLPEVYSDDFVAQRMYKYELPTLIRLFIAESRYDDAQKAIDQLIELASEAGRPFLLLEAEVLHAKFYQVQGETNKAVAALRQAVEMAYPARVKRFFLTEGEAVLQVLASSHTDWGSPEALKFVDSILNMARAGPHGRNMPDHGGPETLSPREIEVLQLLPSGLTAEELAGELIISVNTVRTHMKSIYSKLDVHSRHQAVDRARNLNLL